MENKELVCQIRQRLEILYQMVQDLEQSGGGSPTDAYTKAQTNALLATKVDKVAGSSLMTTAQANKLAGIESGAEVNVQADWDQTDTTADDFIKNKPVIPDTSNFYTKSEVDSELNGKVDKQTGYSLISNADITKLNGIQSGAEVNVQANWNETDTTSDSYILNKPTIPDVSDFYTKSEVDTELSGKVDKQTGYSLISNANITKLNGIAAGAEVNVQANWNETNVNADSYIRNKPTIPDLTNYYNKTQTDAEIQGAITDLDVPSTATTGHYIKSIAQENGLISAVAETVDTTPTTGSSKLITSGGVEASQRKQDNEIVGLVDNGAKNRLNITQLGSSDSNVGTKVTSQGVEYEIQSDGTITAYRKTSSSSGAYIFLYENGSVKDVTEFFDGQHVWSGNPSQYPSTVTVWYKIGSGSNVSMPNGTVLPNANGETVRIGFQISASASPTQSDPIVFKPMICSVSDWQASQKIVPYSPTNRELYEMFLALQNGGV